MLLTASAVPCATLLQSMRTSIAVCISGELRALLEWPVVTSIHEHVLRPLSDPDVFIAISDRTPLDTEKRVHEEYGETSTFVDASDQQGDRMNFIGHCKRRIGFGGSPILRAWTSIGACYDAIVAAEQRRRQAYEWLYRLRTDLVFLSEIFAPPAPDVVVVPSGGMSKFPPWRCMNDHLFACPRRLCRPYFKLLDLFREDASSPVRCTTRGPECDARLAFDATNREPTNLSVAREDWCRLPSPPRLAPSVRERPGLKLPVSELSEQWFFFFLYGGQLGEGGRECPTSTTDEECCGRLRERPVHYTIARAATPVQTAPKLSCEERMLWLWSDVNETSPWHLRKCLQMEHEWKQRSRGQPKL